MLYLPLFRLMTVLVIDCAAPPKPKLGKKKNYIFFYQSIYF